MKLVNRRKLGAIALVASGVVAFIAPFLLHGPQLQGTTTGPGPGPGPGTTTPPPTSPPGDHGGGGSHKKTMKDLLDATQSCDADNHGSQRSLLAKVYSGMRAGNSTRTDHHLQVLLHKLETPSSEKHAGACASNLEDIIGELLS